MTPKNNKLSLQRGRTFIQYELKVPSAGGCMKTSKPKNTIIGVNYFGNEEYFPDEMRPIISEICPISSLMKEETSNDLLVKKILK